jgi:hypothetical protein
MPENSVDPALQIYVAVTVHIRLVSCSFTEEEQEGFSFRAYISNDVLFISSLYNCRYTFTRVIKVTACTKGVIQLFNKFSTFYEF